MCNFSQGDLSTTCNSLTTKYSLFPWTFPHIQSFPTGHPLLPPKPNVWKCWVRPMTGSVVLYLAITAHSMFLSLAFRFFLVIHMWQEGSISLSFNYIEETECYQYGLSSRIYPSISNKTPG